MKKNILVFIFVLLMSVCSSIMVKADNYRGNQNNCVQSVNKNWQNTDETSPDESVWDKEREENIYDNYGSEQSPTFLNRENIETDENPQGDSDSYAPD